MQKTNQKILLLVLLVLVGTTYMVQTAAIRGVDGNDTLGHLINKRQADCDPVLYCEADCAYSACAGHDDCCRCFHYNYLVSCGYTTIRYLNSGDDYRYGHFSDDAIRASFHAHYGPHADFDPDNAYFDCFGLLHNPIYYMDCRNRLYDCLDENGLSSSAILGCFNRLNGPNCYFLRAGGYDGSTGGCAVI